MCMSRYCLSKERRKDQGKAQVETMLQSAKKISPPNSRFYEYVTATRTMDPKILVHAVQSNLTRNPTKLSVKLVKVDNDLRCRVHHRIACIYLVYT